MRKPKKFHITKFNDVFSFHTLIKIIYLNITDVVGLFINHTAKIVELLIVKAHK